MVFFLFFLFVTVPVENQERMIKEWLFVSSSGIRLFSIDYKYAVSSC